MYPYCNKDEIEVGIDEVGRGCLAGPVYTAAVIWPPELDPSDTNTIVRDSKKCSKRKRLMLKDYIEEYAIDFSVASLDNKVIDKVNILNATMDCMHKSLDNLNVDFEHILVDGPRFNTYYRENFPVPYTCVVKGDDTYISIACASVLAKVYHDNYIEKLCDEQPELNKYEWKNNMCYGTKDHLSAIKQWGITDYHRKTFGICKEF